MASAQEPSAASIASAAAAVEALPFGPWKTLYAGVWAGHKTSVFVNGQRVLLLLVHDEAPSQGALVLLKKVFVVDGDSRELVAFLNSQKRSFSVIEKIGREGRFKFLVLDGEATYAPNLPRDFSDVLRTQYSFLSGVSKALVEVASSYRAGVTELDKAPFETADLLLGDPLLLAGAKPSGGRTAFAEEESKGAARFARATPTAEKSFAFLGLNSSREPFQVELNSLRRVTIIGKDKSFAARLMQVVGESVLLNNASCMVFASSNVLHGLSEAAAERGNYDYFRMAGEPHGFPLKEFSLATLKIDLARITADDFLSALGLQQTDFADAIVAAFDVGGAHDLVALMENVDKIDAALFPPAARSRALRVLRCLEREFPHSFGENKPALLEEALRAAGEKTLASVLWVDCGSVPALLKQLHYCNAAALLAQHFAKSAASASASSVSRGVNFLVLVDEDAALVGEAARRAFERASEADVGFCLWTEYSSEASGIQSTLAFELVGADAFASLEGVKTKFALRPTYSDSAAKTVKEASAQATQAKAEPKEKQGKPSFFSFAPLQHYKKKAEEKNKAEETKAKTEAKKKEEEKRREGEKKVEEKKAEEKKVEEKTGGKEKPAPPKPPLASFKPAKTASK